MNRLGGIIYPTSFLMSDQLKIMSLAYKDNSYLKPLNSYRYKNIDLGSWGNLAFNERKTLWITFDGDIANRNSLKAELKNLGYHFSTSTDEEILLNAYDAWKEKFISKLHGFFAIALFDQEQESLLLIRDRIGKKRLFWCSYGGYWVFASDIKAILATGLVPQTPSIDGLASYLFFGYIPQDFSPILSVNKVLPGHCVKVNLLGKSVIHSYWSYSALLEEKQSISEEECSQKLHLFIEKGIPKPHNDNDTVGTFLSSDLGSISLAWFLEQNNFLKLRGFATGEQEPIDNLLHFPLQRKTLTPSEILMALPTIVWHLDEPASNSYIYESWMLGQLAKEKCSVIISSYGWEQMFAGHSRFFSDLHKESKTIHNFANRIAHLPPSFRNHVLFPIFNFLKLNLKYKVLRNIDIDPMLLSSLLAQALFQKKMRKKASPFLYHYFNPEIFTQRFHRLGKVEAHIEALLYLETKTLLPDNLLSPIDQLFTSFDIEFAVPFLNYDLIHFMAKIPSDYKFKDKIPGIALAQLMRSVCSEYSSFEPLIRENPIYSLSIEKWRTSIEFRKVFELLKKGILVEEGLISGKWLKQQLGYPYLIPATFMQLFAILILEIWFRLFIRTPIGRAVLPISSEELLS